ncbi:lactate 2-monooxygenase [Stackebrandtia albiflava]|uniref:Lactate 2-monooxygenase n=1 Tax=Stackebrandtia albiflava TaxID=406432 RepID=A0A562URB9_9ACTN|nr:alpha-hydroxy-acid oxidizing protein [Stackebrandtia albiflava]TWJ08163.1 lactate 2-monooxygenase [Stackebrandtia albiflava]
MATDDLIGFGRAVQAGIYRAGALGRRPVVPVAPGLLAARAARRMTATARAYVVGSAGMEHTARANRTAFDRWRIVPRMLRDVAVRDHSVELFGRTMPSPLLLSPVGVLEMVHRRADLAVAAAARDLGVTMIVSNQASTPMERVAATGVPHWFQLYWSSSDELVASLVRRAEAAGAEAIVVTLDTHMLGWRPRDLDAAFLPFARGQGIAQYTSDPVFTELVRRRAAAPPTGPRPRPTPAALATLAAMSRGYPGQFLANLRSPLPRAAVDVFLEVFSRSTLTWADLAFLRDHTRLPIVLKGIQHPDDARAAVDHGVDAVMVSNHGGRQIDGATGSLDALPEVVSAVADRVPVLFDSGVRGGADVFKAIALGATAVGVGRPYVYGLTLAGRAGVTAVLRHLRAEFDLTMGLAGCTSIREVTRETLAPSPR